MKEKYKTCVHAENVGEMAVYVKPSCPRANAIKGVLVSSKRRCMECRSYRGKGGETDESGSKKNE